MEYWKVAPAALRPNDLVSNHYVVGPPNRAAQPPCAAKQAHSSHHLAAPLATPCKPAASVQNQTDQYPERGRTKMLKLPLNMLSELVVAIDEIRAQVLCTVFGRKFVTVCLTEFTCAWRRGCNSWGCRWCCTQLPSLVPSSRQAEC